MYKSCPKVQHLFQKVKPFLGLPEFNTKPKPNSDTSDSYRIGAGLKRHQVMPQTLRLLFNDCGREHLPVGVGGPTAVKCFNIILK